MIAARERRVGIVRKLIQLGANVNLTNKVTGLVWWPLRPCCSYIKKMEAEIHIRIRPVYLRFN